MQHPNAVIMPSIAMVWELCRCFWVVAAVADVDGANGEGRLGGEIAWNGLCFVFGLAALHAHRKTFRLAAAVARQCGGA